MAKRKRRSVRQLEDLPGLFDDVSTDFSMPADPMLEIIEEHRKKQETVHGLGPEDVADMRNLEVRRDLQFISFGSGSSGNCAYIGIAGEGGLLIDAGVDAEKVLEFLDKNAIDKSKINGILLTHDHGDHARYAYALLRKIPKLQLYCTPKTLNGILRRHSISKRIKDFHKAIFKEFVFKAGPFEILPFEVNHDGTDNVGFLITAHKRNFVVATDMGSISERADFYMRQANYLMIEANYDAAMLATGAYPEYLKARIRSDHGHLNNTTTAAYLAEMWQPHLTDIYLCHLSHDNNKPEIALRVINESLAAKGLQIGDASGSFESRNAQVRVSVLPRFEASALYIHRL